MVKYNIYTDMYEGDLVLDEVDDDRTLEEIKSDYGDEYKNISLSKKKGNKGVGIEEGDFIFLSVMDEAYGNYFDGNKAKIRYMDGSLYIGEVSNRNPHGKGTWEFLNGYKYTGELKMGKYHGYGELKLSGLLIYRGYFKNDGFEDPNDCEFLDDELMNVKGDSDEGYYIGQMIKQNVHLNVNQPTFHGRGRLAKKDSVYEGNFRFGKKHGIGIITNKDGSFTTMHIDGLQTAFLKN